MTKENKESPVGSGPLHELKGIVVPNLSGGQLVMGGIDWGFGAELLIMRAPWMGVYLQEVSAEADPMMALLNKVFDMEKGVNVVTVADARTLALAFLTNPPENKIALIKAVRAATEMNLKNSKFLVDSVLKALALEVEDSAQGILWGSIKKTYIPYLGDLPVVQNSIRIQELEKDNETLSKTIGALQGQLADKQDRIYKLERMLRNRDGVVEDQDRKLTVMSDKVDILTVDEAHQNAWKAVLARQLHGMESLFLLVDSALAQKFSRTQIRRIIKAEIDALDKIKGDEVDSLTARATQARNGEIGPYDIFQ